MQFEDLSGKRFGRLVVVDRTTQNEKCPSPRWNCICDCGKTTIAYSFQLKTGKKQSCGCLGREHQRKSATTHGGRNTRLYHIWCMMKQRTSNPNCDSFHRYGGRGIRMCDEWFTDFTVFRDWALSNGYTDELTIDRIDNDGNYEPSNCRWVTPADQNRNQSTNVPLTYNGQTKIMSDWAEELGISVQALYRRIHLLHWPLERALTETKNHTNQ